MKETPLFFPGDGVSLFGVFAEPARRIGGRPAFVFCHPFGEEKLWTHRACVSFARELVQLGYPVLRFDQRGNGDSDAEFSETSLATAVQDTMSAIETAKRLSGADAVSLLGLRLGGAVAALVADERDDVRHLILWAPIVDGHRFAQELLRVNLATQMALHKEIREDRTVLVARLKDGGTVNVDGYPLSSAFYAQLETLKLADAPRAFAGPCLVVQIERAADAPPAAELTRLQACYRHASHVIVQEEPFWKEIERFYETAPNLSRATLAWLERQ
ncbi:MAG TPA: alpha/beta fold hydrolase [Vicinamibacterales bacterium]